MTGLYVHIPFCKKKCFYCSFAVAVNQKHHIDNYVESLSKEMGLYQGRPIDSIYFGGGTPSQLSEHHFLFLMHAIKKSFSFNSNIEITVEMNPEDVNEKILQCYFNQGVTRLSMGVQTFNDSYLKFLGRCHHANQARHAYELMRKASFSSISIDLMYGFPGQTFNEIDRDLQELARLSCDHVSLYSLTVEEESRFFVDKVELPSKEDMAEQYLFVKNALEKMGFEHYEVSNFAKTGKRSLHNLNYWQGGNYIGLGVAAHSHENGMRWWNVSRVRQYIEKIRAGERPEEGRETLTPRQRIGEAVTMGLRMLDGIDLEQIVQVLEVGLDVQQKDEIDKLINQGYLMVEQGRLKVTVKGLLILDYLSERLV